MKVVYFGSDVFLSCFEYFVEKHQVLALYTYHNDEDYFTEYAIVRRAGELGIPVHYEAISPEEIRRYIRTGEPMDKAGAYGIQGLASMFVVGLDGDYYNVMGLPICTLTVLLRRFGVKLLGC